MRYIVKERLRTGKAGVRVVGYVVYDRVQNQAISNVFKDARAAQRHANLLAEII